MLNRWLNHSATAGKKMIGCFLISALALSLSNLPLLILLLALIGFVLYCCQIGWQPLKPFGIVITYTVTMLLVMHAFSGSLRAGLTISLQMSCIILTSCLLVHTSRELDLINALEGFLQPLNKFGIHTEKFCLALLLTLRSIGMLRREYQQIRCAQQARGLNNSILAIMMPLLIKAFHSAQNLADALIARGFEEQ